MTFSFALCPKTAEISTAFCLLLIFHDLLCGITVSLTACAGASLSDETKSAQAHCSASTGFLEAAQRSRTLTSSVSI